MSSPSSWKNPSSAAAIAGKYEFEIMSGTASFMTRSCLGWSTGLCAGANTRAVRGIASVLYPGATSRWAPEAAGSLRTQAQGQARRNGSHGEPVRRLREQAVVEKEIHDVEHEEEHQRTSERKVPVPEQAEVEQRPMVARLRPQQPGEGDCRQHEESDHVLRIGT